MRTLPSPVGDAWLQVRGHDLWLHLPGTVARALTAGGEPGHGYGVLPDFALRGIPRRQGRMPMRPFAVGWSPDGRYVAGIRYDERALLDYPYLESEDIMQALRYAAWRTEEREVVLASA